MRGVPNPLGGEQALRKSFYVLVLTLYLRTPVQIWLWRATGHETGVASAFWFVTSEHKNSGRLLELLDRLTEGRFMPMADARIASGFPRRAR
jgi:hypothetical protein